MAAVELKKDSSCVQVLEKLATRNKANNFSGLGGSFLPTVFAVDKIPTLQNGRVDKKQIRILFRRILLECDESEWNYLIENGVVVVPPENLAGAKFLCKSIALSTGLPLVLVIRRFNQSFEELGGTPLNAVIVVKMCCDNGYPISKKDLRCIRE